MESCGYSISEERGKDVWYLHHLDDKNEMIHHVLLEYKPKQQAYAVRAGVTHRPSMIKTLRAKPAWSAFLRPELLNGSLHIVDAPCWTLFDAGRALNWVFLSIPDPVERETWKDQFRCLIDEFLKPYFWSVNKPEMALEILTKDIKPFEWFSTNGVLRALEVASISKYLGHTDDQIRDGLLRVRKKVERDLAPSKTFAEFCTSLEQSL